MTVKEAGRGAFFSFLSSFVEMLYPRLCVVCQQALTEGEHFLCTSCLADFPFSDAVLAGDAELLRTFEPDCRPEALYSLFYYDKHSPYRNLIYAVKYRSRKKLGVYLGEMLGERLDKQLRFDAIVPVPLHPRRQRQRGFNQAFRIALGLQQVLQTEILDQVLIRTRNNRSQTHLGTEERHKNVENIFELKDAAAVKGKHLLIVDDVITTGATIKSCVTGLAAAGDVKFSLACLARTMA